MQSTHNYGSAMENQSIYQSAPGLLYSDRLTWPLLYVALMNCKLCCDGGAE